MTTVVGLFREVADADQALEALPQSGLQKPEVSVLVRQDTVEQPGLSSRAKSNEVTMGTVAGAASGATFGTFAGLFIGLTAIAIPGVGPVLSVGALATILGSTVIGAGVGAAAGGLLLGSLIKMGVPEEEAELYAEGVRRGGLLIAVQTDREHAEQVKAILREANAVDIGLLEEAWQEEGWSYFDRSGKLTTEKSPA